MKGKRVIKPTIGPETVAKMMWKLMQFRVDPETGRRQEAFDCAMIIHGGTGRGKSDLALNIALELHRLKGTKLDFKETFVWTRKDLIRKVQTSPPQSLFIVDEAIDVIYNKSVQSKEGELLVQVLDKIRKFNHSIIFNLPSMRLVSQSIRDNKIRYAIWVSERGKAIMSEPVDRPEQSSWQGDKWKTRELIQLEKTWDGSKNPNWSSLSNVIAKVTWDQSPEWAREMYDYEKDKNAYNLLEVGEDPNDVYRFLAWLEHQGELRHGMKSIAARYFDVTVTTITNKMKKVDL